MKWLYLQYGTRLVQTWNLVFYPAKSCVFPQFSLIVTVTRWLLDGYSWLFVGIYIGAFKNAVISINPYLYQEKLVPQNISHVEVNSSAPQLVSN